ncbi:ribose-phosphate pyrophosphokinase [Candidatus Termititenax persephonae]|uniref:Ribose-phosphate pyrophosphokinase n=1 Tax=Candidatus Termititenax persephonae TaxID=2218525 RepID=A0A388TK82_9BACT|nr:ribose-phosphate pyrophosphokinase [Candidatus Termititenax persephonae]
MDGTLRVFPLSSHPEMADKISNLLGIECGRIKRSKFSCGELYTRILENIRGREVYLVQTATADVNNDVLELLIAVDSCKRASASSINVIVPHFPYSRQDKKSDSREPITGRLIANLLEAAGIDRIITMDLHADQIQGFFNVPVDHLNSLVLFVKYFRGVIGKAKNYTVVSPDTGRAKTCKKLADKLGVDLAILHKARPQHNVSEILHVIGEVKGKKCILFDDIIDTAGSIQNAYNVLVNQGAQEVSVAATHAVFSGPAVGRLNACAFKEVVVTNTIPLPAEKKINNLSIIDTAPIFAETVKRNYEHASISELYDI